jgi:hypothetical protein
VLLVVDALLEKHDDNHTTYSSSPQVILNACDAVATVAFHACLRAAEGGIYCL